MVEAYPLTWPIGWPRAKKKQMSTFRTSLGNARDSLFSELRMMGAKNIVLSSNLVVRLDGLPYASQRNPDDVGVAIYFLLNEEELCIPCDKWNYVKDNIHAINKTVEALRGIERWGAKEMVNSAFRGFKALPPPEPVPTIQYFADCVDISHVKQRFKKLAKEFHPDMGGSIEEFQEMKKQYDELIKCH